MADASPFVRFGSPTPWRGIRASVVFALVLSLGFGIISLQRGNLELTPMVLILLLLPAVTIPLLVGFNQYAVVDQRTWLVSINGGQPRPLSHLTHCRVRTFRGVNTIELGYTDRRKDRFIVSSHSPFASPRIERDWVRYLLPYTGLPRDPQSRLSVAFESPYEKHATLEQARHFAHEYLK